MSPRGSQAEEEEAGSKKWMDRGLKSIIQSDGSPENHNWLPKDVTLLIVDVKTPQYWPYWRKFDRLQPVADCGGDKMSSRGWSTDCRSLNWLWFLREIFRGVRSCVLTLLHSASTHADVSTAPTSRVLRFTDVDGRRQWGGFAGEILIVLNSQSNFWAEIH